MTLSRFATPANGIDMTQRLVTALLICVVLVNGALLLLQPPGNRETSLDHTRDMVLGDGGDDSWGVMHVALDQFAAAPDAPLYSELFFRRHFRFQYPPSSLFALEGLRLAGPDRVRFADNMRFEPWPPINDIVGWVFVALTALASGAILETMLRRQPGFIDRPGLAFARMAIVTLLTVTFYPVVKAYTLGQIQVWINALFALSLLCWLWGLRPLGGALIGIVCLIKPHYGLLLLWALLRREWSFFFVGAATAAVGLAAAVSVFGLANHFDYVKVLQFLSQHGEAYYPNQSINGLLNRLMGLGDPSSYINLDIPAGKFPPFNPWIYGVTLVSSIALILYGLLRRSAPSERAYDFARAALCFTMASPIAWEHHYGILLPIFALLLADGTQSLGRLIALAIAYALAANFFHVTQLLAPTILNPLQSYVFFGAIIVLALLHAGTTQTRSYLGRRSFIGT
jgi:alpha-1,2-mannosyltransferase